VRNAKVLAAELISAGFNLVSGGTDNHLVLLNLVGRDLTGKDAEKYLDDANITTNKNAVLNDPYGPNITSGVRLGTPALTTRGFKEADVVKTVEAISLVLNHPGDEVYAQMAKDIVKVLVEKLPLYERAPGFRSF
jgi:glycine hydroxymethyltransferase